MDALTLLREVSEAYRSLKYLAIEVALLTESGDENSSHRREDRVRFFYSAPDRFRYEPCGKNGMIQVADGQQLHTVPARHRFGHGLRYSSVPVSEMGPLPHLFRPDFPGNGQAFLYQGIAERVAAAEILREEDGCHVISVSYEPSPSAGVIVNGPAVLFWVNAKSRLVLRQRGELGHRFPTEDEVTWNRHTVLVRKMHVNEPLPEETFRFTPPPEAVLETAGQCGGSMSTLGVVDQGSNQRRLEHRTSHEWEGDAVVEHSQWKIGGISLTFERRVTFSAGGQQLHITERITGPGGEAESSCDLHVS